MGLKRNLATPEPRRTARATLIPFDMGLKRGAAEVVFMLQLARNAHPFRHGIASRSLFTFLDAAVIDWHGGAYLSAEAFVASNGLGRLFDPNAFRESDS